MTDKLWSFAVAFHAVFLPLTILLVLWSILMSKETWLPQIIMIGNFLQWKYGIRRREQHRLDFIKEPEEARGILF